MIELADRLLNLYQDPTLFIAIGGLIVVLCVGYLYTKRQIIKWLRGKFWD